VGVHIGGGAQIEGEGEVCLRLKKSICRKSQQKRGGGFVGEEKTQEKKKLRTSPAPPGFAKSKKKAFVIFLEKRG